MYALTPLALLAVMLSAGQDAEDERTRQLPNISISKETARVTEHVNEDGFPD